MTAAAAEGKRRGRPRKKRTGRPTPPPLAEPPSRTHRFPPPPPVSRRSSRRPRRLFKEDYYNQDDVVVEDEEEEEEEEEKQRSKKKLKLLLKLHHQIPPPPPPPKIKPRRRGSSSSDDEEELSSDVADSSVSGGNDDCDDDGVDEQGPDESGSRHLSGNYKSSATETVTPIPDTKTLVLILDKLQKKDTYSVFAQPVDPEELPDYHDVIEQPMDFATIRKKLARNAYARLEQFEVDVFLICNNAVQYNAPETVYFRQARSIQELARKKFEGIRAESKCPETIPKSELINQSKSAAAKPIERSACKTPKVQADSDLSSAAVLNSNGNAGTEFKSTELVTEKPVNDNEFVPSNSLLCESILEKTEELSEKSVPPNPTQKPFSLDENRRATYNMSNQEDMAQAESVFATFELESEKNQLVAVGLHTELSYARSLARFSATLGPVAWRMASEKIEKALPTGSKFGPGWVGEYEQPPTPVLSLENHFMQASSYSKSIQCRMESRKGKETREDLKSNKDSITKSIHACMSATMNTQATEMYTRVPNPVDNRSFCEVTPEGNRGFDGLTFGQPPLTGSGQFQQQRDKSTEHRVKIHTTEKTRTDDSERARILVSSSASNSSIDTVLKRPAYSSGVGNPRLTNMDSFNRSHVKSNSPKEPEISTSVPKSSGMEAGGFPNRKDLVNSGGCNLNASLDINSTNQAFREDHVRSTSILPIKVPSYPNSSMTGSAIQFISPVLSPRKHPGLAAATTAQAWMPIRTSAAHKPEASIHANVQIEAPSPNKPSWMLKHLASEFHEGEKRIPMSPLLPKFHQTASEVPGFQSKGVAVFPQIFANELSRFQVQAPWRGLVPHAQQRQSKDMLPPDLNIGFQPPGSPIHQSSGILVDSQQPDLALQL